MKIPVLDLQAQYKFIKNEIGAVINKVIDNQDFILGEEVSALEAEVAAYCGAKYAVGLASGTDALILALKALGIKEGDEVITTPFTFFATAESISIVGAKPVFVDIDPKTYNMDARLVEARITKRTRVIMPVHLYGQCADMDPLIALAKKHGLKVIEDAAQAIGATYKGRKAGSMGDIGCLSFFPSKNLGAFGDAGMIVTNDKGLAGMIRMLRVHGSSRRYIHSMIGTNSRLDNLQAAVLRVKLRHLDRWLDMRRKNAAYYGSNLSDTPFILPHVPDYNVHTYHLYILRVKSRLAELKGFLSDSGIEARTYYPVPLHLQKCYNQLGYKSGDLKEAESAAKETFSVAVYPELYRELMDYVIGRLVSFFKKG